MATSLPRRLPQEKLVATHTPIDWVCDTKKEDPMRFRSSIAVLALVTGATTLPLRAQEHEHEHEADTGQASDIPALTQQDIQNLETGAGMGFGEPAELNHYPGPKHVLEHAEDLALTEEQHEAVGARHSIDGSSTGTSMPKLSPR
jgi:hypothetical protein